MEPRGHDILVGEDEAVERTVVAVFGIGLCVVYGHI
jgi:hypothetical protein